MRERERERDVFQFFVFKPQLLFRLKRPYLLGHPF